MLPMYMNVIDVERAAEYFNQLTAQAPFAIAAFGAVLAELTIASRPKGLQSAGLVSRHWHGIACNTQWNVDQARLQHA